MFTHIDCGHEHCVHGALDVFGAHSTGQHQYRHEVKFSHQLEHDWVPYAEDFIVDAPLYVFSGHQDDERLVAEIVHYGGGEEYSLEWYLL